MKNSFFLNSILAILLCLSATKANAQIELKFEPYELLLNSPKISVESIVSDKIGLELIMGFKYGKNLTRFSFCPNLNQQGYTLRVIGKYYFNPKTTADRWYAGFYVGSKRTLFTCAQEADHSISRLNVGFTLGYKWLTRSGILIQVSSGLGKSFGDNSFLFPETDGFFKLSLGYRF